VRSRKKTIHRDGVIYRDKQEALDFLIQLEKEKNPIHGIEIVILSDLTIETDMYKTLWFTSQKDVYEISRVFITEKMGGKWNYVELKV
jgi:hypothetical protein